MNKKQPVPRLDLAPKLNRPLSLWNPVDYLRLLYWVFYFPQALRWYVDTFGGGEQLAKQKTWQEKWDFLRQNPVQLQLIAQSALLVIIIPFALSPFSNILGLEIAWMRLGFGVGSGLGLIVVVSTKYKVRLGIVYGVVIGILVGGIGSLLQGTTYNSTVGFAIGIGVSASYGGRAGVATGIAAGLAYVMSFGLWIGIAISVITNNAKLGWTYFFAYGLVGSVAILRLDSWLFGVLFGFLPLKKRISLLFNLAFFPLPYFSIQCKKWLRQDWETGLKNINQVLQYSLQFIPVTYAVERVLAETPPEQTIFRTNQLVQSLYDKDLIYNVSVSVSLKEHLTSTFVEYFWLPPNRWRKKLQERLYLEPRIDTPFRAAAAGFWYLHEKKPEKAMEAFTIVRSLPYGDEMFTIAEILTILHETRETETITLVAELQLPNCPQQSLLRPETWKAIESLRRAIEDIRAVVRSVSLATRSLALNRAQGKLVKVLDIKALPEVERELILEIVQSWLNLLVNLAGSVGAVETTQPVRNPYVIGDPVEGRLFVGREDILRELEELWIHNQHLQSVVLYGHRRMGKTSILRNIATHSGSEVRVIYVNLQGLSSIARGVGEVFLAICDEIADALNLPRPDDAELLELPQRTFERYLKQVLKQIDKKGLIIALDEFETLEALIEAGQIPADFMGFLRSLVQMSPQLAFAFAGLHTLEEMTADYFQPFFASVIPIRVGFLKPAATRQLLVNPSEDFPLDYTPEARDRVQSLTAGQPFLVQLVGFQLVRRYNDRVFEEGRKQNPCFEVEDVDAAINPEFFQRGRYYFEGVWKAAQDAAGQQAILQVLAPHPEGLREEDLRSALGVEVEDWERTLQDLQRHDVIEKRGGRWRIAIELFRRWVRRSLEI